MPNDTFFNLPPDKRARIADAAIDEFAEKGYTGASISRIVARAKIAKGSFYQYFDGKIVLFKWLLYDVGAQRKLATIKDMAPPEPGDFWEQLSHMYIAGLRFGLNNPKLSRVAAVLWHPNSDPELQGLVGEFQGLARRNWGLLLQQGQAMGQVRTDLDLEMAAEFAMAQSVMGLDLAMQRHLGMDMLEFCSHPELEERFPVEQQQVVVDQVLDLVRRAIGTDTAVEGLQAKIDVDALKAELDGAVRELD
jgi:AcrR family transcriptional regulator